MCGKEEDLVRAFIEGSELDVCRGCAQYGKIIRANYTQQSSKKVLPQQAQPKEELVELIVDEYAEKIKHAREKLGLQQKELAVKLAERESLIQKMESSQMKPSLELARKLEKFLHITLVKEEKIEAVVPVHSKSSTLTLGDMLLKKHG